MRPLLVTTALTLLGTLTAPSLYAEPSGSPAPAEPPTTPSSQVAGCWLLTLDLPRGMKLTGQLDLKTEDGRLTGTFSGPGGRTLPIEDGVADGSKLSFSLVGPGKKLSLEGTREGEKLQGFAKGPAGGKLAWVGKRCQ